MKIQFNLNGKDVTHEVRDDQRLVDMLRDDFYLTGTKIGCNVGECGACTVMIDDQAVNSCMVLAAAVDGKRVVTIEGISKDGELTPVQQAFLDRHALQCGFCTPGFVVSATALLNENPKPTREEIQTAIAGNLCRCTGYEQIVEAIEDVAAGKYDEKAE